MASEQEIQYHRTFLSLYLCNKLYNDDANSKGEKRKIPASKESDAVYKMHVHSCPIWPAESPMQRTVHNALLFRGGKLEPLKILAKRGQQFLQHATPWEQKYSVFAGNAKFTPVVDEEFSVVGHYGSLGADGSVATSLVVPENVLGLSLPGLRRHASPRVITVTNLASLQELVKKDLVFYHSTKEPLPTGYHRVQYGTTELKLNVLTTVDGQVLHLTEEFIGALVSVSYSPADLVAILKVVALLGAAAATWAIKSLSKRNSRKLLAGPTEDLANKLPKPLPEPASKRIVVGPLNPRVKGKVDATIEDDLKREMHAANRFAERGDVADVYLGLAARTEFGASSGKFPDVVARMRSGHFALSEGKGTDMRKVIEQFKAGAAKIEAAETARAGKKTSIQIGEQEVVVQRLTKENVDGGILHSPGPGYGVDAQGFLLDATGYVNLSVALPPRVIVNGKPIKVISIEGGG